MPKVSNWGNYPTIEAISVPFQEVDEAKQLMHGFQSCIPRGMGRCYGDSALAPVVISTLDFNQILAFDEKQGIVTCQSGTTFERLLAEFVPKGWFPPVTPGTKFVTIGGAIASDVHGKNHHKEGCFSDHVLNIELMTEDGRVICCSPKENTDIFSATRGGMGLTGLILTATFRMKRIETAYIKQEVIRSNNLNQTMELFETSADWTYSMVWIDCLSTGDATGRSVMFRGEHADLDDLSYHSARFDPLSIQKKRKLTARFYLPGFFLNSLTVNAFNYLYYHRHHAGSLRSIVDYDTFFYPLDSVRHWNRIYGAKGFIQYQFLLPLKESRSGLTEILKKIQDAKAGSFLAVLKLFGPQENLISFPQEGYTLALDFPIRKNTFALLDQLDKIVLQRGGRLYLTKDARMSAETFSRGYPQADRFIEIVKKVNPKKKFNSIQSQRIGATSMKRALILGAGADIGKALAKRFGYAGFDLILAARNVDRLKSIAVDIERSCHTKASLLEFDALDYESHERFYQEIDPKPEVVVTVFGYLGDHTLARIDFSEAQKIIDVNYKGAVSILNIIANDFERRKFGTIIGISSVAGDRGREKIYIYGSAKAALSIYLDGLRNRLCKSNVHVITVKPGYVFTKMTERIQLPPLLTALPEQAARDIFRAYQKKKNTVYTLWFWRYIMLAVRNMPESIFKKMKI